MVEYIHAFIILCTQVHACECVRVQGWFTLDSLGNTRRKAQKQVNNPPQCHQEEERGKKEKKKFTF